MVAIASASAFELRNANLARRPAARRVGSSSALTLRALKSLEGPDLTGFSSSLRLVAGADCSIAAWLDGVVQAPLAAAPLNSLDSIERRKRHRNVKFSLILEQIFSSASADLELSLRIPQTPTDFETPSVSGAELSSLDDHSGPDHPEPIPAGPPRQDVLPVSTSTRYPHTYQNPEVSFLETPSTILRVNSRQTKPPPKAQPGFLARTLSGKRRAPLLEVTVPRATHPLDRAVKPPSSPAPFTSNLRELSIALSPPKTLAIPSKAAKLLGLAPTGLPRMTRRGSNSDDGSGDEDANTRCSTSSMCSCLPPRPSFASSPTTLGRASPTPTLNIRTHSPKEYASPPTSPSYTRNEKFGRRTHSPSPGRPSSPFFILRESARSLPDVSTGTMVGTKETSSSPSPSDVTRGFWDRVKYTRSASQPEVSGEILSLARHADRERVVEGGEQAKKRQEEVEVLQKKVRRMSRDDWAQESERLRQRIRESLGY